MSRTLQPRLLILALGMFALGTDSYVIAGILPQVARSFDITTSLAGQFVTVYSLAYAFLTPLLAALTAHWRRERVLVTGLVVFVAGNLLTATQSTFALALVSRGVAGAGAAMFSPAAGAAAASLVLPEQRGRALAIVLAGLSGATALGAPIGTLVAGGGDWRSTMWLVSAVGIVTLALVAALLRALPVVPVPRLRERLAPIANPRVALTLVTTLLAMLGVFLIYTYISVVFDRAIARDSTRFAGMLSVWGAAATLGNLASGHLTDRFGNRRVIDVTAAIAAVDFALMPWTSGSLATGLAALAIWGVCGWALVVAQQHRLVSIQPALAPVLLALNSAAVYIGVSASSALGGVAIRVVDPHQLPVVGAVLLASALAAAELAHRRLRQPSHTRYSSATNASTSPGSASPTAISRKLASRASPGASDGWT